MVKVVMMMVMMMNRREKDEMIVTGSHHQQVWFAKFYRKFIPDQCLSRFYEFSL